MSKRSKKPTPLFVKSNAHPILTQLTEVYEQLETAVIEAESASPARLQAMSEVFSPRDDDKVGKDGLTQRERANQRLIAYASACCREEAIFHPLADAIDSMRELLISHVQDDMYKSRIGDAMDGDDFTLWMRDAAYINLIECKKLLERAYTALGKLNMDHISWEYGECAKQVAQSQLKWVEKIPPLPSRKVADVEEAKWVGRGCAPHSWRHVAAHVMAKVLSIIVERPRGGYNGCMRLNSENHEVSAGYHVMRALKALGWKVRIDSDQDAFCLNIPEAKDEDE